MPNDYALRETLCDYQRFLQRIRYGPNTDPKGSKEGHYGFVPNFSFDNMIHMFLKVRAFVMDNLDTSKVREVSDLHIWPAYSDPSFFDAGCGCGNAMLLAHRCDFNVWGMDHDKKNVEIARNLLYEVNHEKRGNGVSKGDLLKYRGYGKYDVIYYYQPMHDEFLMEAFQQRIADFSTVGCIVIPFGDCRIFVEDNRFKKYIDRKSGRSFFRKTSNKKGDRKV